MINYSHPKEVSLHDTPKLINYRQIDLKKDRHQKIDNLHTDMNTSLSFDRSQKMNNLHNVMKKSQSFVNSQRMNSLHINMKKSQSFDHSQEVKYLYTDIKKSQSFDRQSSHSFRTFQSFQSTISTTSKKLFTLSSEKRSLFELIRSLISSLIESIRLNEPRRHSANDLSKVEIHSSILMKRINEISTDQISLEIIDIFERLNITNKIEKAKKLSKKKTRRKINLNHQNLHQVDQLNQAI
jgi:hypothetical protein